MRAAGVAAFLAAGMLAAAARAAPSLEDYRHFRALSIDLNGRMPTRAELAAFEAPGFDLNGWIDQQLHSEAYVSRLTRVYMDLMRLNVGPQFQFVPALNTLRRVQVLGPDGVTPIQIYFRQGQRRPRIETDGEFCLSQAETGLQFPRNAPPTGTATPVAQSVLDAQTVLVKPWWLYRDYASAAPAQPAMDADAGFLPVSDLRFDDGGTAVAPVQQIRVCKEEGSVSATDPVGHIWTNTPPRTSNPVGPPPAGRLTQPPLDSAYAIKHAGETISCTVGSGLSMTTDCGCGVGLERCLPGANFGFDPPAFAFSSQQPLGIDQPVDLNTQTGSAWSRVWWGEEARHFIDDVFRNDKPVTDLLTSRSTVVNGPLKQFYSAVAPSTCCGAALGFVNMKAPDPLFDPSALPADLLPQDVNKWEPVADRGAHASGLLTMPIFATKYGSRRAKAHVLYNAFLCRDFVAPNVKLSPSTEPNLMIRDGCSTCHVRLEPMAAYFSRIQESDWTWLPDGSFPVSNPACRNQADGGLPSNRTCITYYDPAFGTPDAGLLRGAYGSPDHAAAGPAGMAQELINDPQFPGCVAQNVAASFLGRALTAEDTVLKQSLADVLTQSGYSMRALVKALVTSAVYARSNNLNSSLLRDGGTP